MVATTLIFWPWWPRLSSYGLRGRDSHLLAVVARTLIFWPWWPRLSPNGLGGHDSHLQLWHSRFSPHPPVGVEAACWWSCVAFSSKSVSSAVSLILPALLMTLAALISSCDSPYLVLTVFLCSFSLCSDSLYLFLILFFCSFSLCSWTALVALAFLSNSDSLYLFLTLLFCSSSWRSSQP